VRERTAYDEPDHPDVILEAGDGALQQLAMFWESVEARQTSVDHRSRPPERCTGERGWLLANLK
jgi:predicted dehydrogenase